ncbi:uncharacterized protein LOC128727846 [Anopheles nili]|uniref:uncharacterized protein LOC128727846 n=1 Tax=Anopheles nili TaxID=185578 RepID=UPI00237B5418|nr:uncharacterized protein LOC128727846 [Anopheles nili]
MRSVEVIFLAFALIGRSTSQEETHLPDYLVFMKQFMVNIQVREPTGIIIWTRNSPLIEMFGLELYIARNAHKHQDLIWDRQLLVNSSVVVDGKFLIEDEHMVVRQGDTIRYRFSVLHKHILSHSNFRRILVTEHLFYRPKNDKCYSQCLLSDQNQLHEEVSRLKDILERKILECIGSQASELLFFPLKDADKLVADPHLFVKYRLWQIDGLRPLTNNVVTTYLARNGVGFRMYTMIDKFKVLELGKGLLDVIDFDFMLEDSYEKNFETA